MKLNSLLRGLIFGFVLLVISHASNAQEDSTVGNDLFNMSLEDLMNLEITVASNKAMTSAESPAIVSVITQTEIENSGARDLVDVLRLVPGIDFGVDVQGQVGLTMRGNWAHEGKVLLRIDGQEVNELAFSTVLYGNHFLVESIKRIEIIRGPGSSIYGGFAELGVINIITERGEDIKGVKAYAGYGNSGESGRYNTGLSVGQKINDFQYSLSGSFRDGNRSDRDYTDIYGDSFSMQDYSSLVNTNLNGQIEYKGLSVRLIYDDYNTESRDLYDEILDNAYAVDFGSFLTELKYDWKISDKVKVTPRFNYFKTISWQSTEDPLTDHDDLIYTKYDRTINQYLANVSLSYDPNEKVNVLAGVEYKKQIGLINSVENDYEGEFYNGTDRLDLGNFAAFAQGLIKTKIVNMTLGIRTDVHSIYGAAFAPRVGITKSVGDFHAKLLYNMAFRSPGIENINLNAYLNPDLEPNIKPEQTQVVEMEAGYKLTKDMILTANVYHIKLDNTIVYSVDEDGNEGYANVDVSGTKGLDIEYKIKQNWGYAYLAYSFYSAKGINKVPDYQVGIDDKAMLGTPQHKLTLNSSFNIYKGLSINPSMAYMGKRYAYTSYDAVEDDVVLAELDDITLFNLFANYRNIFVRGLNIGIGVYNLFDAEYDYAQPYNGWHAPYPGKGREFIVKASFDLGFKR